MEEVNDSRVLGGVHFRHAVDEGAKLGAQVAEAVLAKFDGRWSGGVVLVGGWVGGWGLEGGSGSGLSRVACPCTERTFPAAPA